jgi:lambda family phage portal protein
VELSFLDKTLAVVAPSWQLSRLRARAAAEVLTRHYEGAASGRRTAGWNKSGGDANAQIGPAVKSLRAAARDLVRNNPYAQSAVETIVSHVVGWGIKARLSTPAAQMAFDRWANSTECSIDGRADFATLQQQALRAVVETGEVLIRRFIDPSMTEKGLIPIKLQVLEADFIDTDKNGTIGGNKVINGIEIDAAGRRVAYWLFSEHPGAQVGSFPKSERADAANIEHVYRQDRPGQLRGVSWFAPVMVAMKDFDEYADATLVKAKVAACLAVVTSDPDGSGSPLGPTNSDNTIDTLEPGMILNLAGGKSVSVVQPPQNADYDSYSRNVLRAIATGLGISFEDMTGDYVGLPFSAARMSRMRHWARVDSWRWSMLVPQFLNPVSAWVIQAGRIAGQFEGEVTVTWSPPPMPMLEPDREGLAVQRNIRTGILTLSEAIRERGFDPQTHLQELAADFAMLDNLGLKLDCDPRHQTQAGQMQSVASEPSVSEKKESEDGQ